MRSFLVLLLFFSTSLYAQEDSITEVPLYTVDSSSYKLGNSYIPLTTHRYDTGARLVFVNLHHDEATSVEAAVRVLDSTGGVLVRIENGGERLITFEYRNKRYTFDPNRIFTPKGIVATLKKNNSYTPSVVPIIQRFAQYVLGHIPKTETIIALHNNTPDKYSVRSYTKGGAYYKDARAVHIVPDEDEDDFFLTTSVTLYRKLKAAGYNTVWQNNKAATDDGSLSIYYGRRGKSYVNVEAEEGHLEEQTEMIWTLVQLLQE